MNEKHSSSLREIAWTIKCCKNIETQGSICEKRSQKSMADLSHFLSLFLRTQLVCVIAFVVGVVKRSFVKMKFDGDSRFSYHNIAVL